MKLKKMLVSLVTAVMLLAVITVNVFAVNPTITCETKSISMDKINVGDYIELEITLNNSPELVSIMFHEFTYDKTKLELIEGSFNGTGQLLWGIGEDEKELDSMGISFNKNQYFNGIVATIKFRVLDKTIGSFEYGFSIDASYNDSEGNVVSTDLSLTPGSITITCPHINKTLTPAEDSNCIKQGNNTYYTCTDCGAILKEDGKTETTIEAEKRPIGEHTFVKHDKVEPDHKNAGMAEYYTCSVCSKIFDSAKNEVANTDSFKLEPIPHTFGDEWKFDETNHWHECECGEKTPAEAHTVNDWTVVKEADEKTEGLEKGVCSVCGYETSRVIPPLKHEHTIEKVDAKAATCAAEGNIEHYTCTKCHKNFSDEAGENEIKDVSTPKDPDNHTGETKVVGDFAPTCKDYGYTGDTVCAGCEAVLEKGKEIEPTGEHKNTEVRDAKEADCIHEGYTGDTYCLDCGTKIKEGNKIEPTGVHDFEWVTVKEAKFGEEGLEHQVCKVCQAIGKERPIPPLDCFHGTMEHHEKVAATCINTGTVEYWHCTKCNRNYSDEKGTLEIKDTVLPIDPTNHVNTEIRNARPATCISTGNSGDTYCTDCGILVTAGTVTSVDPNAHNYVNNVCTYCGNVRVVYRPTTYMYIDDYSHLASGIKERHVPDSMTMHTDGEYEWHYCMYCQHEYGKVRVVDVDDTIDIAVDDPVQSGDDETIPDVPVTEPEPSEPVQDNNPPTGIAIALLPMALAAAAAIAFKKTNR